MSNRLTHLEQVYQAHSVYFRAIELELARKGGRDISLEIQLADIEGKMAQTEMEIEALKMGIPPKQAEEEAKKISKANLSHIHLVNADVSFAIFEDCNWLGAQIIGGRFDNGIFKMNLKKAAKVDVRTPNQRASDALFDKLKE